jgi:hypothetical protein
MSEDSTPIAPSSEQLTAVAAAEPSEQGAKVEATQPAAEVKAPEPESKVDVEAIRREAVAKVKHDLESQYGKQLSEATKRERERARQEREQLLTGLSDFVPDEQLKRTRDSFTSREAEAEKDAKLAQLEAYAAQVQAKERQSAAEAVALAQVQEAGYKVEDLPRDVLGDSVDGFEKRFSQYVIKENAKLKKDLDAAVKKATEDAIRDTERRLGVTRVTDASPVGGGAGELASLQAKHRDAVDRNDKAKIAEYGRLIEEEVYRGR